MKLRLICYLMAVNIGLSSVSAELNAQAIYRHTNPDGTVSYSDQPNAKAPSKELSVDVNSGRTTRERREPIGPDKSFWKSFKDPALQDAVFKALAKENTVKLVAQVCGKEFPTKASYFNGSVVQWDQRGKKITDQAKRLLFSEFTNRQREEMAKDITGHSASFVLAAVSGNKDQVQKFCMDGAYAIGVGKSDLELTPDITAKVMSYPTNPGPLTAPKVIRRI